MTKQGRKSDSNSNPRSGNEVPSQTDHDGNRRRTRKFKILMVAFSALLFLALDLIFGSYVRQDQQKSFRRPHPYFHHALRTNQNRRTHWGGLRYSMITNSLGFRDSEIRDVPLQSDARRVVLIGDSMIEGLGVRYEDTVAGQLQQRWAPQGVEVFNAGVVSFSPHLYHLRVRHLIEEVGLQFTHLIVFIDISDIQDETFYETFQPVKASSQLADWWRGHSLMYQVAALFSAPEMRTNNQFRTDAEVNVWMEATDAYQVGTDPEIGRWKWTLDEAIYEQWGRQGLRLARTHMTQLNDLCSEHQIELTVAVYPAPAQIYANDIDSRQVRFWQEFCEEFDLTLINLFPTFIDRAYAGPGEIYQRFFNANDTHWNPAGHHLVADKIDQAIGDSTSAPP